MFYLEKKLFSSSSFGVKKLDLPIYYSEKNCTCKKNFRDSDHSYIINYLIFVSIETECNRYYLHLIFYKFCLVKYGFK